MEWNEYQEQFPIEESVQVPDTTTTEEVIKEPVVEEQSIEMESPETPEVIEEEDDFQLPDWLQEDKKQLQDPKVNSSFAEMRRQNKELQAQLEEMAKYKKLLEDIGAQQNMAPDYLVDQYYQSQQEKQAEAQGIPLEVFREMNSMKQEMETLRQDYARQALLHEITDVAKRYNINIEDKKIANTWRYAVQKNLIDPQTNMMRISFEDAFKQANFDSFVKEAKEKALQDYLASKKERQSSTPVPHGNLVSPEANTMQQRKMSGEEVRELFAKMGLPL